jgi:hypothetical protein
MVCFDPRLRMGGDVYESSLGYIVARCDRAFQFGLTVC